jgi:Response regulator containing CheY-like receiver domain and AraC-type DNA-binding domain
VRILVVDDDYISRRIIIKTLSDFGRIDVFSTGAEAKEALILAKEQKLQYDVLLIDGVLPDAYGWDIVKDIRKKEALRTIEKPLNIIVTSGFDDFQSISRKLDIRWMLKPINIKLLREMVVNMQVESKAS